MKDNIVIFPGWYPTEEGVWFGCKLYKDWRLLREAIPEGVAGGVSLSGSFSIAGRSMAGKAAGGGVAPTSPRAPTEAHAAWRKAPAKR